MLNVPRDIVLYLSTNCHSVMWVLEVETRCIAWLTFPELQLLHRAALDECATGSFLECDLLGNHEDKRHELASQLAGLPHLSIPVATARSAAQSIPCN